jgi:hypothetical protein
MPPLRMFLVLVLCSASVVLALFSFAPSKITAQSGPKLAVLKLNLDRQWLAGQKRSAKQESIRSIPNPDVALRPDAPTFGHPIIAGIGGTGFEESIRIDPTLNANGEHTIYTSAPGSLSADTSWVWHSLDGGRTFKWVVGAAPLEGKVTTCHGGGDSEIAVDPLGRLYFNDLTLANFSTSRSDDFGATFTCSNTGVPDTAVDRQWYAIDGDPLNGGSVYLANDEIGPGGVVCGTTPANNVLVMYRSPVTGLEATAGIAFGPANHVSPVGGCDEAIMGNNEISPIATTLGQPTGPVTYATLPAAVKHIFVIHDNVQLNKILIGRCFPVAFGAPVANVSDPSGLNCTDLPVADLGANQKTGANFPTLAIDSAGNLYAVWEQAPLGPGTNATGDIVVSGDTVLKYSYSTDQGNTWSAPIQIDTSGSPDGVLHNNVFAWINAGDNGRVNIVWYGTPSAFDPGGPADLACGQNTLIPPPQGKNINGPDAVNGLWSVWMVQSLNAHDPAGPVFTPPIRASAHHVHRGGVQTLIGGQCGWASRALGDYLQLRTGPKGDAHISYADSNNRVGTLAGHAMYVHQNSGTGLYAANSPVSISGLTPFNGATDPSGDGKYEVSGLSSANMPQLDILSSSMTRVTSAPCSGVAPCYKVVMQINNLSLAPTPVVNPGDDPDPDLVWHTQWFVPSTTDGSGGKNFHVYAESFNGAALQCFVGENDVQLVGGGGVLTYPGGTTQLPAANCQSTIGPNGNITIYVPLSNVTEAGAIDGRLHEVTASTMTLLEPANTHQPDPLLGTGGSFFNLIDVAQGYTFDPILLGAVSRKNHGSAGTFDIDLLPPASGIECRSGGTTGDFQVVVTFAVPISFTSASVSGTGSVTAALSSSNQAFVNLTGVTNAQRISVTLHGVNDGTRIADFSVSMGVLLGDVNGTGLVDSGDVFLVRQQSGQNATSANFREDVNPNGVIDSGDVFLTRQQTGTSLP